MSHKDSKEGRLVLRIAYNCCTDLKRVLEANRDVAKSFNFNLSDKILNEAGLTQVPSKQLNLMHIAAFYDSLECLVLLHQNYNIDIDIKSPMSYFIFYYTPLHYACLNGSLECAQYLLQNGADPNALSETNGHIPLYLAAYSGNARLMNALFDYNANLDTKNTTSKHSPLLQALKRKKIECLDVLLRRGFKPTTSSRDGNLSPLMQAIVVGLFDAVEPLLAQGADANYTNASGNCALYLAIRQNKEETVQLLLDNGADPKFPGPTGINAVHAACATGNLNMLKMLIDAGADRYAKTQKGQNAAFSALQAPQEKMIEILTYLYDDLGFDINATEQDGKTTILLEILADSKKLTPEVAKFLLSRGANIYAKAMNDRTAFEMVMTQFGTPEIKAIFKETAEKLNKSNK